MISWNENNWLKLISIRGSIIEHITFQARYAEMNRKQKERMEKEKLRDEEDSKKSAQSNDPGKHFVPSI